MSQLLDLQVELASRPPDVSSETATPITLRCEALKLQYDEGMFSYPLTKKERDDLSWYLEDYWKWPFGGFAQRGSAIEQLLPALGQRLYQAAFGQGAARDIIQQWQADTSGTHQISIITTDAGFLSLPWELLHNGQDFLVLQTNPPISIARRIAEEQLPSSLLPEITFEKPLRVLLVTARPVDEGQVDVRTIAREVADALQEQRETGAIELEFLRPPTFDNLVERLSEKERPIHILHFDGHGEFRRFSRSQDGNTEEEGRLFFEKEDGKKDSVDAASLAEMLHYGGVKVAVLNACKSAAIGERDSSSSVAIQLLKGGLQAVVAMSASIQTTSAALYVKAFYRALAAGGSIQAAHRQAQQVLHDHLERNLLQHRLDEARKSVNLQDWWLPYLYVQHEQMLYPLREEELRSRQPIFSPVPLLSSTMPPTLLPSEFIGRSAELLQIERSLLRKKIVVVSGFGGIGKTALARETAAWLTRTNMYDSWCFISFEQGSEYRVYDLPTALEILTSLLNQQRVLIILDDIEGILPAGNAAQGAVEYDQLWKTLAQLRNNGAGVLITGRYPKLAGQRFVSGTQVDYLELKGLAPDDAYTLAMQVMNANHIDQAHVPYVELCDLLALLDNHPLAIRLTVPALQSLRLEKVQVEFASLLPTFQDDQVRGRNRSLLASMDYSLCRLSEIQRGLLPCLSLFRGGASEDDLLAITEIPSDEWTSLREALEQTALLMVETIAGFTLPFFHFHPILVPSLRNQQGDAEEAVLRESYMQRYFDLARMLYFEDKHDARMRLRVQKEWLNLCQAQEWLRETGRLEAAAFMTEATARFLTLFGRASERGAMRHHLSMTISEYGTPEQGTFTYIEYMEQAGLAEEEFQQGNFDKAADRYTALLTRMETLPEGARLSSGSYEYCTMLFWTARCLDRGGQYPVAEAYFRKALMTIEILIQRQPENKQRVQLRCAVLSDLAHTLRGQGKYAEATLCYEQALEIAKQLGNRREQAVMAVALGEGALEQDRDSARAKVYFTRAVQEFHALNEPINEAHAWNHLGRVAEAQGDGAEAERCYREGLSIYERLGDTKSAAAACNLLASVAITSERFTEAEEWYRRALRLDAQKHPDSPDAKYLLALANLLARERTSPERLSEAKDYAQQALTMFEAGNAAQMIQATRNVLARIAQMEGQIAVAESHSRREREAYAAFEGNRSRIDRIFGEIITAIATAAMGNTEMQHALEEALRTSEPAGWNIAAATQRIWAGERNWHILVEEMDNEPSLLILRVLETIALEEEKASLQQAWKAFTDVLPAPIYEAIQQENEAALEQALEALQPEQQQQVLAAIQALERETQHTPPIKAEALPIQQTTDAQMLSRLATHYHRSGNDAEAEVLLLRAIELHEQQSGPNHPEVATCLTLLADCYKSLGKQGKIEPLLVRACAIYDQHPELEGPEIAMNLNTLALHFEDLDGDLEKYQEAEALYKRAYHMFGRLLGAGHLDTIRCLNNLALLYKSLEFYAEAEPLLQLVLEARERRLMPEHVDLASSLTNLAECYDVQGKYVEAEPLYKRALQMREHLLGPEHPDTIANLNNLALLYRSQKRYEEAESLLQQVLELRERQPGSEHVDIATNLTLAQLYKSQKRYEKAEPLLQRVLEERERRLRPEHRDLASSLTNLAECYEAQGKYAEAEPLYKRALQMREHLLGPEHPDIAQSLTNLAGVYYALEQYEKSEPLSVRALALKEQQWGSADLKIVTSLRNLADVYYAQDSYADAEPLYQRALAIREQHLGFDHPDTIRSLNDLAYTYMFQKKYEEAERCFARVLASRECWPGSNPLDIIKSLNHLAAALERQGKYEEAEPLYLRVLQTREHLLGVDHPDIAQSLTNLAGLYYDWKQYGKGEPLLVRALALREQQWGPADLKIVTSLTNLADIYFEQKKYEEAEPLLQRVLAIREQVSGNSHQDIMLSLNDLATLYKKQGRYSEAEPLYLRVLTICEQALGAEHSDTINCLDNLGLVYYRQKKYEQARPLWERVLAIQEKLLGVEHLDTALSLHNLATLYLEQEKYKQADVLFQRARAIYERELGSEHLDTTYSLNELAVLYRKMGKYDQAESLFLRTLLIREKELGIDHPMTQMTRKDYTILLQEMGRNEEANRLEESI